MSEDGRIEKPEFFINIFEYQFLMRIRHGKIYK
jgi:hypothetical protein